MTALSLSFLHLFNGNGSAWLLGLWWDRAQLLPHAPQGMEP